MQTLLVQEEERHAAQMAEREMAESKKMLQDETRRQNDMQLKIKKDYETKKEQNDLVLAEKVSGALSNLSRCLFTIWCERFSLDALQSVQRVRDYNEAESKKKSDRRRKMVEYGRDLKRTIDERNDARTKERTLKKNEYSDVVKLEESR